MRLTIVHRSEYRYDAPVQYALQRLRLWPSSGATQTVRAWRLSIEGAREEARFSDQFGNDTRLLSVEGEPHTIVIEASGEVETRDTGGVVGAHRGLAPLWLFLQQTPLTAADEGIAALAEALPAGPDLARLHQLMTTVAERVAYRPNSTDPDTTAGQALAQGAGVCQDQAQIFISAARLLGYPARYISGYLMLQDRVRQTASHAWAEAHVEALGWVAFDVTNGISADGRYVRLACGRDYHDAMPVSGIRLGQANEELAVDITVEQ